MQLEKKGNTLKSELGNTEFVVGDYNIDYDFIKPLTSVKQLRAI